MSAPESEPHRTPGRAMPDSESTVRPTPPRARLEEALVEIKRVIVGQDEMLERVLVCLARRRPPPARGRPRPRQDADDQDARAAVLGGTFRRIQFTPDLVPGDLVGTRIYRPDTGGFDTELGPVFCNFLLADEINRAPGQGAVGAARGDAGAPGHDRPRHARRARPVPRDGDAEPDRVGGHVPAARGAGRPLHAEGRRRLPVAGTRSSRSCSARSSRPPTSGRSSRSTCLAHCSAPADVYVDPPIVAYAVSLAEATRDPATRRAAPSVGAYVAYGASPRGPIALVQRARALALVHGRDYVLPARRPRARQGRAPPPARARRYRGARRGAYGGRRARRGAAAVPSRARARAAGSSVT